MARRAGSIGRATGRRPLGASRVASEAAAGADRESEIRAEAPDAAVAKTREDELHDGGSAAKTTRDDLHDRMHLAAMVTAAVDTAVTKQLEERLTAHGEAVIESRAARWDCWAECLDAWDADRAKMTEEAKQVLKQHTESLEDLVAQNSRIGWAKLSGLEEKAEESDRALELLREELDKLDGMICDGFQDAGTIATPSAPALSRSSSQVKQLPERIKRARSRAEAVRGDRCGRLGEMSCMMIDPLRKSRVDELVEYGWSRSSCRKSRAGA